MWYADLVNFIVYGKFPKYNTKAQKDRMRSIEKYYIWDDPYLWKYCVDQLIRRCVPDSEFLSILTFYHSYACGGHFGPKRTARKVLESEFYWPSIFKDAYEICKTCDNCRRTSTLGPRNEMLQTPILICVIFLMFGVWIS